MNRVLHLYRRECRYLATGETIIVDHAYVDVPSDETTWRANARRLAAEANEDKLFAGKIDWPLASLIAREMVGETWQ